MSEKEELPDYVKKLLTLLAADLKLPQEMTLEQHHFICAVMSAFPLLTNMPKALAVKLTLSMLSCFINVKSKKTEELYEEDKRFTPTEFILIAANRYYSQDMEDFVKETINKEEGEFNL